ncbi:hypothetical protein [Micropruina sp.]|uniref:hypothetical protein n=1 Tax=Micropruina sp. TaxID=2737536 RepID=UPI0039E4A017
MMIDPYPSLTVGLDLGQAHDYSALAVVEHVQVLPEDWPMERYLRHRQRQQEIWASGRGDYVSMPTIREEFWVRHLQRWAIGTPYHEVVRGVGGLLSRPELLGARLYYDRTGVGAPVGDSLWQAYTDGRMGRSMPNGVTITGEGGDRSYAKRDLMQALQLPIQQGRFRVPQRLPLASVLERELSSFQMKLTPSGRATFDIARREGEGHGDLVLAVSLAVIDPGYKVVPRLVETAGRADLMDGGPK